MPDDERTVAQLAAAFRQALADKRDSDDGGRPGGAHRDGPEADRERRESAVLVATGAALGDEESLPGDEADDRH